MTTFLFALRRIDALALLPASSATFAQTAPPQGILPLTMLVSDAYRKAGADQVNTLFSDARTHSDDAGARFNAARVADGLKGLKGNPFGAYFSRATP